MRYVCLPVAGHDRGPVLAAWLHEGMRMRMAGDGTRVASGCSVAEIAHARH